MEVVKISALYKKKYRTEFKFKKQIEFLWSTKLLSDQTKTTKHCKCTFKFKEKKFSSQKPAQDAKEKI